MKYVLILMNLFLIILKPPCFCANSIFIIRGNNTFLQAIHLPCVMVKYFLTQNSFNFRKIESCTFLLSFDFFAMVPRFFEIYVSGKIDTQKNVYCFVKYGMPNPISVFNG